MVTVSIGQPRCAPGARRHSQVVYVRRPEELYEPRPSGAEREALQVLDRRARTDNPVIPMLSWQPGSAGRFPARVGGPVPDPASRTSWTRS